MRIMVTGGTSFIGSYVVRRLTEEGHEITVLARNPAKVPGLRSLPSVRFLPGTLTSTEAITEALRGQEACIHIALGWGDSAVAMAESDTLPEIAGRASRGEPITVTRNAGLQFIWAGDLATVYSSVLGSTVNREVFTSLSPDFITWEQIARWAVEICGSASEIVVQDRGLAPALITYDVSAIEQEFGLKFDATNHLREHLAYLAGHG